MNLGGGGLVGVGMIRIGKGVGGIGVGSILLIDLTDKQDYSYTSIVVSIISGWLPTIAAECRPRRGTPGTRAGGVRGINVCTSQIAWDGTPSSLCEFIVNS